MINCNHTISKIDILTILFTLQTLNTYHEIFHVSYLLHILSMLQNVMLSFLIVNHVFSSDKNSYVLNYLIIIIMLL